MANRLLVISVLEINDAEQVQAVKIVRLGVQDRAIQFFGVGQSAGLMQGHRPVECRRQIGRSCRRRLRRRPLSLRPESLFPAAGH